MTQKESNAYILGTEQAELHRLGLQHQVWASEARKAWTTAEFSQGQTILDLGCGPGFCTRDLAYIVGNEGKVIGVDKSSSFIEFLNRIAETHHLNIETQACDFNDMVLEDESLDGCYSRWALAWLKDPLTTIEKVVQALKPGGVFIAHEYYDWSTLQSQPEMPNLKAAIAGALKSFKTMDGDIDIGRTLPQTFYNHGLEVIEIRPMTKLASPNDFTWHWPKSFFKIYFPKVAEMGFISAEVAEKGYEEFVELEYNDASTILCPQMVEVIAIKV